MHDQREKAQRDYEWAFGTAAICAIPRILNAPESSVVAVRWRAGGEGITVSGNDMGDNVVLGGCSALMPLCPHRSVEEVVTVISAFQQARSV